MTKLAPHSYLSDRAQALAASKIREVAEIGMGQTDVLPLWFGEGAWATSPLIVDAAVASLRAGNHKYQPNNGAPDLRDALASYSNGLFTSALNRENITVTPSGMQGLMLTAEILISPRDRVVVLEPGWPNLAGAFTAMGAALHSVTLAPKAGRWSLDLDDFLDALTPDTKAVLINSPNNPTGWTMTAAEQRIVLDHCRKHGIWIVADDVYTRLYRHAKHAPSFLSIADPDDLLISVNSFSKCWSMTGWRLGWLTAPKSLAAKLGQLTEFNTSCTAGFIQDAGRIAVTQGESEITDLQTKIATGYAIAADRLSQFDRVQFIQPDGAFYCFFKVDGLNDSFAAALEIIDKTKVGLAPGIAFGTQGEGYLRLCYAQPEPVLHDAFERLGTYLG
ncbi:aminotransferase class I/II-fold pyridoxal phosphate-dependent enzyme [Parasedimentitalea marina]|uniref:Aminotransferase n=1 Tax=Parasedimentitalea marina TaxID=2483033 RepID=A0A3T0N876_9RHOB|nr:pyridoxal phosphate-dependent aminotransferase [Parasedimentitalea marina]AZV80189.1 aminotransferase class I/II-fold pyridoxal phosphate-dependent enzyme [Parasedimentitalea marina]